MLAQTHLPQDTYVELLFLTQTALTLPEFQRSKGQVPIRMKDGLQEPFRTFPEGSLARHGVCSHKHRCRKIPMLICLFGSNRIHPAGIPAQQGTLANPPKGLAFKRPF